MHSHGVVATTEAQRALQESIWIYESARPSQGDEKHNTYMRRRIRILGYLKTRLENINNNNNHCYWGLTVQ